MAVTKVVKHLVSLDTFPNTCEHILTRSPIAVTTEVKATVYNFKNTNWPDLKELLPHTPCDMVFVANDV